MENEKIKKDAGFVHDFMFYLENAIALENHALASYSTTKDQNQLQIAEKVRRNRSKWMYSYIKESKNQIYCESKHLMGCSMALKELGNRFIERNEKQLAEECFEEAQIYESIFMILNEGGK